MYKLVWLTISFYKLFPHQSLLLKMIWVLCLVVVSSPVHLSKIPESTLVQAHILFRHGDRTPDPSMSYSNDPYKNETFFPFGKGELTQKGKLHAFQLGKSLARRYNSLIGPVYYQNEIEAISSSYNRCQMTLQLVLAGMYPPSTANKVDASLNWQPMTYQTLDPNNDKLINTNKRCQLISKNVKEINRSTEDLYEYVTFYSGDNVESADTIYNIYDTIFCETEYGLPLPVWIEPIWPEHLRSAAMEFWVDLIELNLAKHIGNILEKVVADTKIFISSQENKKHKQKKLILYSGHDSNNVLLLGAFNAYKKEKINYVANFVFEVHFIERMYGFKLFFQNGLRADRISLHVPGCGTFCPLNKFEAYVKKRFSPFKCV